MTSVDTHVPVLPDPPVGGGGGVSPKRVVLVTGMSGAGKTAALKTLEDLGYFAIDNLPSSLYDPLLMLLERNPEVGRVALGMDGRDPGFVAQCQEMLRYLRERGHAVFLLFLDASDGALIRRFSETRRPHPLARGNSVEAGVLAERQLLAGIRKLATRVQETTSLNIHQLRQAVVTAVQEEGAGPLTLIIESFGYKYGLPLEAAFVFDVRFLPNPFFETTLAKLDGRNEAVARYVFSVPSARSVVEKVVDLVVEVLPLMRAEGRSSMLVGVGCTGGQHRSVAVACEVSRRLQERGVVSRVEHRDLERSMGGRG